MSTLLPHIASRIYGRPLLLHPSTAALITDNIGERFGVAMSPDLAALVPEAPRFRGTPTKAGGPYTVENGSAIVTVTGELCNRGAWIGASSGLTSYEGITAQLRAALNDATVSAIVLDLNTPGGEAVGCFECAAEVRAAAKRKPVTAFVNGMATSAGYALASGASRIIVTPSSIVGSIGVVMVHVDRSKQLDKQGVAPTLIFAGAHKTDGHSLGPLPDAVKADITAEIGKFYDLFVNTVATYRGLPSAAVRGTEARCYMGADAVGQGLADAVGTLDDALASRPTGLPIARVAPRPTGATQPVPAPAAQPIRPPPNVPRQRTAAELRASQLDACLQIWRNGGRADAADFGFPPDVFREAGAIIQSEASASWDDVIATTEARYGVPPRKR